MTEHPHDPVPDLTPPPEVVAALQRWAAATDPIGDPVQGPDVRSRGGGRWGGPGRHALLAAAVVLVALVAAATVWAVRDDGGPSRVTTDPDPTAPPGTVDLDVVVDTRGIGAMRAQATQAVAVVPACGPSTPCPATQVPDVLPVHHGTSLVARREVADGTDWVVLVESWVCGRFSCGAGPLQLPSDAGEPGRHRCTIPVEVDGPTLVEVTLTGRPDQPDCDHRLDGPTPTLTVPPDVSLREPLPWSCGAAPAAALTPDEDPEAIVAAWQCVLDGFATDRRVELPVRRTEGPGDDVVSSWWRFTPEATTVIRAPSAATGDRWTVEECSVRFFVDPDEPARNRLEGCDPPWEPSLAYVPPADRTRAEAGGGRPDLDLVVVSAEEAGPPPGRATSDIVEGYGRWVLTDDGRPVAAARVQPGATAMGTDDLEVGGGLVLRWDRYVCLQGCHGTTADGSPNGGEVDIDTRCEAPVPADARRVVVTLRPDGGDPAQGRCEVAVVDELPTLTVPPAWSLRAPLPYACGDSPYPSGPEDTTSADVASYATCITEELAAADGAGAELQTYEGTEDKARQVVLRADGGVLTATRAPAATGEPWTQQTCTGAEPTAVGEVGFVRPTGCGPEQPMALDPP